MMRASRHTREETDFLRNIGFHVQFFRKMRDISQEELAEQGLPMPNMNLGS